MQDENVWMMNYKDEEECRWDLLKRPYIIAASFTECPDGGVELTKYIKTAGAAKTSIMVVCAELLASVARNMVRLAVPEKVKFINNIRDVAIRHLFDGMSACGGDLRPAFMPAAGHTDRKEGQGNECDF